MNDFLNSIETFYDEVIRFPDWQQDILVRILKKGKQRVIDSEIPYIILNIKKFFGIPLPKGQESEPCQKLERDMLPADLVNGDKVTINGIEEINNINALVSDGICFTDKQEHSGLSIVYGRNGSGKSGFVRIIKAISAFKQKESEPIYKNCWDNNENTPSAVIIINGDRYLWTQGAPTNLFARKIRVFDSKNATIYINGDRGNKTEIVYVPDMFRLLDELAEVLNILRNILLREKTGTLNLKEAITKKFLDQEIKDLRIDKDTPDEEINSLISFDTQKKERLDVVKNLVENRQLLISQKTNIKNQLLSNRSIFEQIENTLSIEKIKEFIGKIYEKRTLSDSLKKLKEVTENANPLPGACSDSWDILWRSAITYLNSVGLDQTEIATCPLCMQSLDNATKERVKKFQKWIDNDIKKKLDVVEGYINGKTEALQHIKPFLYQQNDVFEDLKTDQNIYMNIKSFITNARHNFDVLNNGNIANEFIETQLIDIKLCEFLFSNDGFITKLMQEIKQLSNPATEQEITEYQQLKRSLFFSQNADDIKNLKRNDQISDALGNAINACSTDKISRTKTTLSKLFINERFGNLLKEEKKALNIPHDITLNVSSDSGKAMQSLVCNNTKNLHPYEFMSEGEIKISALACFLAEYKMSGASIPLCFDDPITSLDHNFQNLVVKRIAELAKQTQCIVFTHNLVFANELKKETDSHGTRCDLIYIKKSGGQTGIKHTGEWEAKPVNAKIQHIREKLNELPDDAYQDIRCLGAKIREIWEQSIEDILLNKAITRFSKDIKTNCLEKVIIDEEIYPLIEHGMSKTSEWTNHDQPENVNTVTTKREVKQALDEVEAFITKVKSKRIDRDDTKVSRVI